MSNPLLTDIEQTSSAKQDTKNRKRRRDDYLPLVSKTGKNRITSNDLVRKSMNVGVSISFRNLWERKESKREQQKQLVNENLQNATTDASQNFLFLLGLGPKCSAEKIDNENNLPKCEDQVMEERDEEEEEEEEEEEKENEEEEEDEDEEEEEEEEDDEDEDKEGEEEEEDAIFAKPQIFECYKCYKVFFHKPLYRKHMLRHMKIASRCRTCGQSLVTRYLYKRHQMSCR